MLLYNQVSEKLEENDEVLTSGDCSKISMMTGEEAENIFLLILHYCYLDNPDIEGEEIVELLYKYRPATKSGLGAKFNLLHLPEKLQRIIKCYLRLISSNH